MSGKEAQDARESEMRRIDVTFNGQEYTFRSNDGGDYLFVGAANNWQISCEGGFKSLRRMKAAIRAHLRYEYWRETPGLDRETGQYPRIKFTPDTYSDWES